MIWNGPSSCPVPDTPLIEQERATLRNIVMLSDIRAEEWMRPRTQFVTFRPPVSLADLQGKMTPSGYLLITEGGQRGHRLRRSI